MTIRMVVGALLAWCAVAVAEAPPVFVGTWKLNVAKSKHDPGPPPKSLTHRTEAVDGGLRQVADSVSSEGKGGHSEYTARFDGKDYPITGSPRSDSIWFKKVDEYTVDWAIKKAGAVVESGRTVYSRDGKTKTVTWARADEEGTWVFEKE